MNQYCSTFDLKMFRLTLPEFDATDAVPITFELVIGKIKNLDKHVETLEDTLYSLLVNAGTKEMVDAFAPKIYHKDGNLIIGIKFPIPIRSALKRTPMGSLEIPDKIQKLLAAID